MKTTDTSRKIKDFKKAFGTGLILTNKYLIKSLENIGMLIKGTTRKITS